MLILTKLYNSFYISKDSKKNNNALSAYMTEFQSYNVIDTDYKKEIKSNTKIIYVETPSNPLLQVIDLKEISTLAKKFFFSSALS